jgi:hypothetical protein
LSVDDIISGISRRNTDVKVGVDCVLD